MDTDEQEPTPSSLQSAATYDPWRRWSDTPLFSASSSSLASPYVPLDDLSLHSPGMSDPRRASLPQQLDASYDSSSLDPITEYDIYRGAWPGQRAGGSGGPASSLQEDSTADLHRWDSSRPMHQQDWWQQLQQSRQAGEASDVESNNGRSSGLWSTTSAEHQQLHHHVAGPTTTTEWPSSSTYSENPFAHPPPDSTLLATEWEIVEPSSLDYSDASGTSGPAFDYASFSQPSLNPSSAVSQSMYSQYSLSSALDQQQLYTAPFPQGDQQSGAFAFRLPERPPAPRRQTSDESTPSLASSSFSVPQETSNSGLLARRLASGRPALAQRQPHPAPDTRPPNTANHSHPRSLSTLSVHPLSPAYVNSSSYQPGSTPISPCFLVKEEVESEGITANSAAVRAEDGVLTVSDLSSAQRQQRFVGQKPFGFAFSSPSPSTGSTVSSAGYPATITPSIVRLRAGSTASFASTATSASSAPSEHSAYVSSSGTMPAPPAASTLAGTNPDIGRPSNARLLPGGAPVAVIAPSQLRTLPVSTSPPSTTSALSSPETTNVARQRHPPSSFPATSRAKLAQSTTPAVSIGPVATGKLTDGMVIDGEDEPVYDEEDSSSSDDDEDAVGTSASSSDSEEEGHKPAQRRASASIAATRSAFAKVAIPVGRSRASSRASALAAREKLRDDSGREGEDEDEEDEKMDTDEQVAPSKPQRRAVKARQAQSQAQALLNKKKDRFPEKLYRMINHSESQPYISWTPSGTTWIIPDLAAFEASGLLSLWFKHDKLSSFLRQCNIYSFDKPSSSTSARTGFGPLMTTESISAAAKPAPMVSTPAPGQTQLTPGVLKWAVGPDTKQAPPASTFATGPAQTSSGPVPAPAAPLAPASGPALASIPMSTSLSANSASSKDQGTPRRWIEFQHPCFVRDKPELLEGMTRNEPSARPDRRKGPAPGYVKGLFQLSSSLSSPASSSQPFSSHPSSIQLSQDAETTTSSTTTSPGVGVEGGTTKPGATNGTKTGPMKLLGPSPRLGVTRPPVGQSYLSETLEPAMMEPLQTPTPTRAQLEMAQTVAASSVTAAKIEKLPAPMTMSMPTADPMSMLVDARRPHTAPAEREKRSTPSDMMPLGQMGQAHMAFLQAELEAERTKQRQSADLIDRLKAFVLTHVPRTSISDHDRAVLQLPPLGADTGVSSSASSSLLASPSVSELSLATSSQNSGNLPHDSAAASSFAAHRLRICAERTPWELQAPSMFATSSVSSLKFAISTRSAMSAPTEALLFTPVTSSVDLDHRDEDYITSPKRQRYSNATVPSMSSTSSAPVSTRPVPSRKSSARSLKAPSFFSVQAAASSSSGSASSGRRPRVSSSAISATASAADGAAGGPISAIVKGVRARVKGPSGELRPSGLGVGLPFDKSYKLGSLI